MSRRHIFPKNHEVRSGYDLAALRLHVSLPPLFLQGNRRGMGGVTPWETNVFWGFERDFHVDFRWILDGFHGMFNGGIYQIYHLVKYRENSLLLKIGHLVR